SPGFDKAGCAFALYTMMFFCCTSVHSHKGITGPNGPSGRSPRRRPTMGLIASFWNTSAYRPSGKGDTLNSLETPLTMSFVAAMSGFHPVPSQKDHFEKSSTSSGNTRETTRFLALPLTPYTYT